MPGITEEMFAMGAMTADYSRVMALTEQVTDLLTNANTARIEKDGHVLTLDLRGRRGVSSPGDLSGKGAGGKSSFRRVLHSSDRDRSKWYDGN